MNALTIRCIKGAFVYLALGIGLGASFAIDRSLGSALRMLHAECNVWGWATLLIYGMSYHMLPRFVGRPLLWPRVGDAQSWLALGGVALTALGWLAYYGHVTLAPALLITGGVLQLAAACLFATLIGTLLLFRVERG